MLTYRDHQNVVHIVTVGLGKTRNAIYEVLCDGSIPDRHWRAHEPSETVTCLGCIVKPRP